MGFKSISLKMPTDFSEEQLRTKIKRELRINDFTFQIENKSLDARKKSNIFWLVKVAVSSPELKGGEPLEREELEIPHKKRKERVVVVGSGPAGFFAAFVLQKAGFKVTLIERGSDVETRGKSIRLFEKTGTFNARNNYAFGEGGAGTFSDGKLTSRSKHISKEKQFILSSYVKAGAPEEIEYMAHPHLGTDNLRKIVKNLRNEFEQLGGEFLFETLMEDIVIKNYKVTEVITNKGTLFTDALFIASGHSAFETAQPACAQAKGGLPKLSGVKAAEYRLTSSGDGNHQVFSFCMCPGGMVVPAAAYANTNIVNGMSYYQRNGEFANAACVVGIHPDELAGKTVSPLEALENMSELEQKFYEFARGYKAPGCSIQNFLKQHVKDEVSKTSYPLGLMSAPLWKLLPRTVVTAMQAGLVDFIRKMRGFETGILLGLESKTSSPVQVIREQNGLCTGFQNLYIAGEGSGYAGGIISSAADGIKAAMHLIHAG